MDTTKEKLYDIWSRRNPKFEITYDGLIKDYTDYGVGSSADREAKGKILGGGYEIYIYAFFIGLYSKRKRELVGEKKVFGQPICFWGNLENRKGRKAYPRIRDYMFAILLAKVEFDIIALEKGRIDPADIATAMIRLMEEYANYGFYLMKQKIDENPNYFYKDIGFVQFMMDILKPASNTDDEIESLD